MVASIGGLEAGLRDLQNQVAEQTARAGAYDWINARIKGIGSKFGNNREDMTDFIVNAIAGDPTLAQAQTARNLQNSIFTQRGRQLLADINTAIDQHIGLVDAEGARDRIVKDIEVPEVAQTINGLEIQTRMVLDNVYSTQQTLRDIDRAIENLRERGRTMRVPVGTTEAVEGREAFLAEIDEIGNEIKTLERQRDTLTEQLGE